MLKSLCEEINNCVNASSISTYLAMAVELDVAGDGGTIKLAVEKAWECFGRIDALVNNSGIRGGTKSSLYLSEEEWKNVVRTNLIGSWLVSKYVALRMVDAVQEGCIINISSSAGTSRTVAHGAIAYGASKTGLNKLFKLWQLEALLLQRENYMNYRRSLGTASVGSGTGRRDGCALKFSVENKEHM